LLKAAVHLTIAGKDREMIMATSPKNEILVTKRNGNKEPLNIEKLHKVVFWATEGIQGVSASEVEIRSQIQFYNGIDAGSTGNSDQGCS